MIWYVWFDVIIRVDWDFGLVLSDNLEFCFWKWIFLFFFLVVVDGDEGEKVIWLVIVCFVLYGGGGFDWRKIKLLSGLRVKVVCCLIRDDMMIDCCEF